MNDVGTETEVMGSGELGCWLGIEQTSTMKPGVRGFKDKEISP